VRDHEGGAPGADTPHGPLDLILGGAVDSASAIIQDEDTRVGEERASNGYALALSAGQSNASLADLGLIAISKASDESMGLSLSCRLLNRLLAGLWTAEGYVVGQGAREQKNILLDAGDLRSKRLQVPVAHIHPIDEYPPVVDIEDTIDELGER
jgi:hypothetical protein